MTDEQRIDDIIGALRKHAQQEPPMGPAGGAQDLIEEMADELERLKDEQKPDLHSNLETFVEELRDAADWVDDGSMNDELLRGAADRLESMAGDLDYLKQRLTELAAEKAELEAADATDTVAACELEKVPGIDSSISENFYRAGYETIDHIAFEDEESVEEMAEQTDLHPNKAKQIWYAAQEYLEHDLDMSEEEIEQRREAFLEEQAKTDPEEQSSGEGDELERGYVQKSLDNLFELREMTAKEEDLVIYELGEGAARVWVEHDESQDSFSIEYKVEGRPLVRLRPPTDDGRFHDFEAMCEALYESVQRDIQTQKAALVATMQVLEMDEGVVHVE